ncbi:MAG: AAA family ATPase [Phototrophicaceae bacterium]
MRIQQIQLERFKQFKDYTLVLEASPYDSTNVTLLIGDNGRGKSTVLQAIAATLATATRQLETPEQLEWAGFLPEGLSANHRGYFEVRLTVEFTEQELKATRRFYERSDYSTLADAVPPKDAHSVALVWTNNPKRKYPVSTDPMGAGYFYQFQGRRYAYNLLSNRQAQEERMFKQIGGIFWYTEQRTSYSLTPFLPEQSKPNSKSTVQPVETEQAMRNLFVRWFATAPHKVKLFNDYYNRLFMGKHLARIEDVYGATITPVYFNDGVHDYDVSELSAGERAIIPILLDFVEWDINHSVILIDELELHLHPPLQQALLMLLPQLGTHNQFIITSHSEAVASLMDANAIRLVGEA